MSTQDKARHHRTPRETATELFAAVAAKDVQRIIRCGHPQYTDEFVPIGKFTGREAVGGFFGELFAAFPDFEQEVTNIVAEGPSVAVEWRARGTFTGAPFQGIEPTGHTVEVRGVDFMDVREGLVRRNTIYYDGASFARSIGMLPQKDSRLERLLRTMFNLRTKVSRRRIPHAQPDREPSTGRGKGGGR